MSKLPDKIEWEVDGWGRDKHLEELVDELVVKFNELIDYLTPKGGQQKDE